MSCLFEKEARGKTKLSPAHLIEDTLISLIEATKRDKCSSHDLLFISALRVAELYQSRDMDHFWRFSDCEDYE